MKSYLVKWDEAYRKKGLVIVDIDDGTQDTMEAIHDSVQKAGIKFAVAHDPDAKTVDAYGVKAFPAAYLIGTDGRVVWEGFPLADVDKVEKALKKELEKVTKEELERIKKDP